MWFKNLCPRMIVEKVEEIDLAELKAMGFKYLLLDLDNTLCSWKRTRLPAQVLDWLNQALNLDFALCVVSNSFFKFKVKRINRELGFPAINRAGKPRKGGFLKALEMINGEQDKTVVVGDQVFTDVWGGNRLGFYTILVKPVDKREFLTTFFQRNMEKILLKIWKKSGLLQQVKDNQKKFIMVSEGD